jgi:hypothetical protein
LCDPVLSDFGCEKNQIRSIIVLVAKTARPVGFGQRLVRAIFDGLLISGVFLINILQTLLSERAPQTIQDMTNLDSVCRSSQGISSLLQSVRPDITEEGSLAAAYEDMVARVIMEATVIEEAMEFVMVFLQSRQHIFMAINNAAAPTWRTSCTTAELQCVGPGSLSRPRLGSLTLVLMFSRWMLLWMME